MILTALISDLIVKFHFKFTSLLTICTFILPIFTQGMSYIHFKTNIGSHGYLKTSNVLVSDNFTMKIADFGECIFMSDMKKIYHHSEIEYNKRKDIKLYHIFYDYLSHFKGHIHNDLSCMFLTPQIYIALVPITS